ncbi:DUF2207 domain-containing protein [Aequorivita sp. H23M31]|uniref:DUF2207 domain-containing protein n=1 Tax=Aequorivita ciconiae TaxID=2494375 RepID=A0A451FS82_9FLAO|nr:DUF2207 domain-containing protein [Aequorivita sp. H23M31]QAA80237.1 DUF2207 domain-containing protein [Aequorivita sp. H23M31]
MKPLCSLLLLFLGILNGFSQGFEVNRAKVDIYISEDGYFDVIENYDLTFTEHKHGIYRDIQTNYDLLTEEGKREKRRIKIRKIEVPGHKFESDFDFVQKLNDNLQIKIGDKNVTLIGPQHYEIKYRVYNAFLFEKNNIRFYWNVKPAGWLAKFNQLVFTVHPPKDVNLSKNDFFVYSGPLGETKQSNQFKVDYTDGVFTARSMDNFISYPGYSVTVLLNLPSGSINELKPFWPFWTDYGWTLILAILLFVFYRIWEKYGKDEKVVATTSYFPPSGIDPAMAGFLIDDRADTPDLISLIPCWGSRGIIKMEQIPKKGLFGKEDTKLTMLKTLPADSPVYEEEIFTGLFGSDDIPGSEILISSLKDSFYTTMASAKQKLKSKAQIYYDPQARKVQTRTIVGFLLGNALLFVIFLFSWGLWAALALIPVTIFLMIMSSYLVKKNSQGNRVLSDLKGFKQFIKVAEENKLKMLLQDSPNYFETTMAYAVAFGLFDQWARKFESLNVQPPSWYTSSTGAFTMGNFTNSFSSAMTTAQSTMVSSPSSSSSGGGGSSGGGFGGGGGGSW